jgi:hypothetical protein
MVNPRYGVGGLEFSVELVPTEIGVVDQIILPPVRSGPVCYLMSPASRVVHIKVSHKEHNVIVSMSVSDLLVYYLVYVVHGCLALAVCLGALGKFINTITKLQRCRVLGVWHREVSTYNVDMLILGR